MKSAYQTVQLSIVLHVLVLALVQEGGQQQEVEQELGPEGLEGLGQGVEGGLEDLEEVLEAEGEEGLVGDLEEDLEEEERRDRLQTAVPIKLLEIVVIVVA